MRPYLVAATSETGVATLDLYLLGVLDGDPLDETSVDTAELVAQIRASKATQIGAHINSIGGSLFGGVAMYNALVEHPAKVTCTVEGLAASAASLVAMAGKCVMGRGAMMMIHNPQGATVGDANDHRRTADVLDKARDSIVPIYTTKTGKSDAAIKAMLDDETWMTADEAKRQRFADEIADDAPATVVSSVATVAIGGVVFPRNRVPAQLRARPTPAEQVQAKAVSDLVRAMNARRDRGF